MLSPDTPIQESWGPRFSFVERSVSSQGLVTKWTGQLGQLRSGTKYHVIVSATDAQGRSAYQTGTVRMDDRKVRITLLKIKVISDADKGSANKGEIKFDHWIGDREFGHADFRRIASGSTINVAGRDGRPGVLAVLDANGTDPVFKMGTRGAECDWQQLKYCVLESGWAPHTGGGEIGGSIGSHGGDYATAGGTFHLNALLAGAALPATFGDESSGWSRRVLCVLHDEPLPQVRGLRLPRRVLRVARPTGALAYAATCASATSGNLPQKER